QEAKRCAIKSKLSEGGYSVRKVQPGIGHYDVMATDNSGAKVDLDVNPRTGEIMKPAGSGNEKY
ncbi:MAG TPA: PepSY domain-containing protein, partial [Geobacterales bacterium]|nr:PepSY domain-containing protein [Geobacterales bacterium]